MGEIDHYLDASFLVALLTVEAATARAVAFAQANPAGLLVSDFAAAEFASAISRRVRMRQMPVQEAQLVLSALDRWLLSAADAIETSPVDVALATKFLRRLDLPLRTPDAIHVAIAQRVAAELVTFDQRMAVTAQVLGVTVAAA